MKICRSFSQNRNSKRFILTNIVLPLGEALFLLSISARCVSPNLNANSLGNCTVAGHGPYPHTLPDCIELGVRQAQTNCILASTSGSQSEIALIYTSKSEKQNYTCIALPMKDLNCEAHCERNLP